MHEIPFLLGLCSRPRWGNLQRYPEPLAGFKGPTAKRREGKGTGEEEKEGGRDGSGRGRRGGKGRGGNVVTTTVPC